MINKQEAYKIMTPQEIYDDFNNFVSDSRGVDIMKRNPKTGEPVYSEVADLYYDDKEEEAVQYIKELYECEEEVARQVFDIFKSKTHKVTPQMVAAVEAHERGCRNKNVPKCPTCGSTNIKKISSMSKAVGMLTLGILDADIHRTFYCKNCGYRW